MLITKRKMIASVLAAAAVVLGGAGAVAAAHTLGGPATRGPVVAPADQPGQPGVAAGSEPADQPDQPGVSQTPEPEDGPGDTNEGPGE